MNNRFREWWLDYRVVFILRVVVAGFFLVACLPKLRAPHEFAVAIFRYQILSYNLVNVAAVFMPWLEFVAAVALLVGRPRWRCAGLAIITGMLLLFTAAISVNLYRGIDIACGCFSVDPDVGRIGGLSILRNTTFILICLWIAWYELLLNREQETK